MEYKSPLSKKRRKEEQEVLTDIRNKLKMNLKVTIFNLISESSHDIREISRIVQDTLDQDDTISIKIHQNETFEASDTDLLVCFAKKFCQNEVNERKLFIWENFVKMIDTMEVCFTEYLLQKKKKKKRSWDHNIKSTLHMYTLQDF